MILTKKVTYSIINLVNASVYWKDIEGRYLGCNQYMLQMAGLTSLAEIIGKTDHDLVWKDSANKIRDVDQSVLRNGHYCGEEHPTIFGNRNRVFLTTKDRLIDKGHNIIGIIGVSVDITTQKEAEQLRIKNLEQQVTIEAYQNFKKCLYDIQNTIQTYKINILNNKLGVDVANDIPYDDVVLTKREQEILYYLSLNKSPKEIAAILTIIDQKDVAASTVQAVINKQLYPKFDVRTIGKLIERANMLKLIPFSPDD